MNLKASEISKLKKFFWGNPAMTVAATGDGVEITGTYQSARLCATVQNPEMANVYSQQNLDWLRLLDFEPRDFPLSQEPLAVVYPPEVASVVRAAAEDDARYVFNGIAVGNGRIIGCDGRRLHLTESESPGVRELDLRIIPIEFVRQVLKAAENSTICLHDKQATARVRFTKGGPVWELTTQYIDGQYPNVDQVIPKKIRMSFSFDRHVAIAALKMLRDKIILLRTAAGEDKKRIVQIYIEQTYSGLQFRNSEKELETVIAAEFDGDMKTSPFLNLDYLLDALESVPGTHVDVGYNRPELPVQFDSVDQEWLAVVMPFKQK